MKERSCVIVDAYSTGRYLPEEFERYEIGTVHVMSAAQIPAIFQPHFNADLYDEVIRPPEQMSNEEIVEFHAQVLRGRKLEFVIAGCETGVELADSLSERLGLPSNGTALSAARRDKARLSDALGAAGVRSIRQVVSNNAEEVTNWKHRADFDEIVVKPLNSTGTEDVFFCSTDADIRRAVGAIVGKTNRTGAFNHFALGQEKINGQQYTVNAVSIDGEAFVTEAWTYDTVPIEGASSVCSVERLLGGAGNRLFINCPTTWCALCRRFRLSTDLLMPRSSSTIGDRFWWTSERGFKEPCRQKHEQWRWVITIWR
ncbi:hypothetical protein HU675_0002375 [Bradyrhizobium septentrionale]|uniref:hypothetical protein n=1 Tax=Bradyrhizobium septentrionale TaxID=1404411 RepID=UPI001CD28BF3|nr:hypothetical protein [Bradyrhizobium septentrionale]UGY25705.1 hypothetical protein HU675_0002375 [Bradyrhizobium septentrionale]